MRKTKLSAKEIAQINAINLAKIRDGGYARIRNYGSGSSTAEIFWNLNAKAKKDQIFKIKFEGKEVLFDKEELDKFLRWV